MIRAQVILPQAKPGGYSWHQYLMPESFGAPPKSLVAVELTVSFWNTMAAVEAFCLCCWRSSRPPPFFQMEKVQIISYRARKRVFFHHTKGDKVR